MPVWLRTDLELTSCCFIVLLFALIIHIYVAHGTAVAYNRIIILIHQNVGLNTYLFWDTANSFWAKQWRPQYLYTPVSLTLPWFLFHGIFLQVSICGSMCWTCWCTLCCCLFLTLSPGAFAVPNISPELRLSVRVGPATQQFVNQHRDWKHVPVPPIDLAEDKISLIGSDWLLGVTTWFVVLAQHKSNSVYLLINWSIGGATKSVIIL